MNKKINFTFISVMLAASAFAQSSDLFSDKNATKETIHLYQNLKRISAKGFLFGHQDDLAYGVHWKYQKDSSDVKETTGDYPALYGWDLSGLESDKANDIDGIPFKSTKKFVQKVYARGGVNTFSWHSPSPLGDNKNAWDTTHGTVSSILPGGVNNDLYKSWLDKVAAFFGSLKGKNGEAIPILFRPFHELSGTWFWWCKNTCSDYDFKTLFRFEVYYLREVKGLHNLIVVYNTSDNFSNEEEFMSRYPGDDMVDVVSFDTYQYNDPQKDNSFIQHTNSCLDILDKVAAQHNKIEAIAETGFEQIPYAEWWTKTLIPAIGSHKIAYVLVWRNAGWNQWLKPPHMHYYVPFKGDVSADDFVKFYNLDNTFFQKDATAMKLYDAHN